MAATVKGTFTIIDRATGPLKRMEAQAKRTQTALHALGRDMDGVATKEQSSRIAASEKGLRSLGREAHASDRRVDTLGRSMRRTSRETHTLSEKLARFGQTVFGLSRALGMLKLPALAAGIGALIKVVGALAAGVAALLPNIVDLVAVVGAAPAAFTGMALAVTASKLAFKDMGKALSGNEDAFKSLTPEAQKFVTTLKSYKPVVEDLRRASQKDLLPGLDVALQKAQRGVPLLKRLLQDAGGQVGRGTARFSSSMTSDKALADLKVLGNQGNRIIGRTFDIVTDLTRAFMSFGVAAEPFTEWMTTTIRDGARSIRVMSEQGKESGRLAGFFERSKKSMQLFGRILHNLWDTFRGIGRASRDLGDDLWSSSERATRNWARWINSFKGQNYMRTYFDSVKDTLHETFGLVGDIFRAIVRLSGDRSTGAMVAKLRELVPLLEKVFGDTSRELVGPLVDGLKGFLEVFSNTGYFASFIKLLAQMGSLIGFLSEKLPGMSSLIQAAFAYKFLNPAIQAVRALATGWMGVASSATEAAAAQQQAGAAGAVGGATGGGGILPVGSGGSGGARGRFQRYRDLRNGSTGRMPNGMRYAVAPVGRMAAARGALSGGGSLLKGLGTGLRGAGKAVAPISALFALSDFASFDGSVGERTQNALSGATFGLVPRPKSAAENRESGNAAADAFFQRHSSVGDTRKQMAHLQGLLDETTTVNNPRVGKVLVRPTLTGDARERVQAERDALKATLKTQLLEQGAGLASDFQNRMNTRGGSMSSRFANVLGATRGQLSMMGRGSGARSMVEEQIAWGRATAGNNKKMLRELADFEKAAVKHFGGADRGISIVNGKIETNTKVAWRKIRDSMATAARQGVTKTSAEWQRLHREAMAVLRSMGITGADATSAVNNQTANPQSSSRPRPPRAPALDANSGSPGISSPLMPSGDGLGIGGPAPEDRRARVQQRTSQTQGGGLMGAKAGLSGYASKAAEFGLTVSSGMRGGAITSSGNRSYHASGDALDLAGSPSQMMAFAQYAAQNWGSGLEELIYTPLGSGQIKNGVPYVYTGAVAADHRDHVHIADTAPGSVAGGPVGALPAAAGGVPQVNFRARKSGLPGVTGALADKANQMVAAGLSALVNEKIAGGAPGGGGVMSFDSVARLAESVGLPGVTFAQIAKGESGFNPRAIGNDPGGTQGLGLWQITTGFNDDIIKQFGGREAMFDPQINAQAAKAIYDRQGIGAWYGTKFMTGSNLHYQGDGIGHAGWFGTEGTVTASSPTVLGIGERGTETAVITRGKPGGGGVKIGKIVIENHRDGDIRKQIKREVEQAFNDLSDTVGSLPMEDDTEGVL